MRFSRLALSASIAAGTSVHAFGGHVAQSTMSMGTIKVFGALICKKKTLSIMIDRTIF
jgi:hypothetical protein